MFFLVEIIQPYLSIFVVNICFVWWAAGKQLADIFWYLPLLLLPIFTFVHHPTTDTTQIIHHRASPSGKNGYPGAPTGRVPFLPLSASPCILLIPTTATAARLHHPQHSHVGPSPYPNMMDVRQVRGSESARRKRANDCPLLMRSSATRYQIPKVRIYSVLV